MVSDDFTLLLVVLSAGSFALLLLNTPEPIMSFLAWLALSILTVIFVCRLFAVSGAS
jgi:hypothetical protein